MLERHTMHTLIWIWVIKVKVGHHALFAKLVVEPCGRSLSLHHSSIWLYQKTRHKIQYPNFGSVILSVPHSFEISAPVFVKFKACDDLNSSFLSEADDVPDTDFLDISEINTSSSTSTFHSFYISENLIIWYVTSPFQKYLPSFWFTSYMRSIFLWDVSHTIVKKKRKHFSTSVKKKALSFVITLKDFCYTLVQYPVICMIGICF